MPAGAMIRVGPEDLSVPEGDNAVFRCMAFAEPSIHTVTWDFQGTPISSSNKYIIMSEGADTSVLTILNVSTSDAGVQRVFEACDSSAKLYRKPVRGDLLLCDRWQTSAQACICC